MVRNAGWSEFHDAIRLLAGDVHFGGDAMRIDT
jgi:hypothetical protein